MDGYILFVIAAFIVGLFWLDRDNRRKEAAAKAENDRLEQSKRDERAEKRNAQLAAYQENIAALADFKTYMNHNGDVLLANRCNYPLFLWEWGRDLPLLRWREEMKPVPLEEMTIVASLNDESLDLRKLWLHHLPIGNEMHAIIRPSCGPPPRPIKLFAGGKRKGYVAIYMDKHCRITAMAQERTTDSGYDW